MSREYFHAYHSFLKSMEPYNDAERGRLFTAMLIYSSTGEVPELRGNERYLFPTMKEQIDRDRKKYEEKCEKQSQNARMRWDANACQRMPTHAKHAKEKTKEKTKTKEISPLTPQRGEDWGFGADLAEAFSDWLSYKQEKRQAYKPTGLKSLLTQTRAHAARYGEDAVASLIRQSMANGWQGIIWDRLAQASPKPTSGGNPFADLARREGLL